VLQFGVRDFCLDQARRRIGQVIRQGEESAAVTSLPVLGGDGVSWCYPEQTLEDTPPPWLRNRSWYGKAQGIYLALRQEGKLAPIYATRLSEVNEKIAALSKRSGE
jgi:hypothetical protein